MTLEELQSLTDRELDALAAEKVMGWKLYRGLKDIPRRVEDVDEWPFCIIFDDYVMKQNDRRVTSQWSVAFAPSSDLNLAAQVEEKAIEKVGIGAWLKHLKTDPGMTIARATARERVIACLMAWQGAMDLAQALNDTLTQYDDALRNLGEGLQENAHYFDKTV